MRVLGIETSCDDTGVAIYDGEVGLRVNARASQVAVHAQYGGVVPELAARDHLSALLPLVAHVIAHPDNGGVRPDAVAYTEGPGLAGALLVGASVGMSLAYGWGVPRIGVHHMEGHLLAPMLEQNPPQMPLLALLVSGGHTMLVDVEGLGKYRILGQSRDDAAGEAFDKTAKLLGLGYPGGPALATAAQSGREGRFVFSRPMTRRAGLDFSFSGLKTQVRTTAAQVNLDSQTVADIALGFEVAVVETLAIKCRRALKMSGRTRLVVSGGVGANARLRQRLRELAAEENAEVFYPCPEFCTDNGAMIAYAGYARLRHFAAQATSHGFGVRPRWSLEEISPKPST